MGKRQKKGEEHEEEEVEEEQEEQEEQEEEYQVEAVMRKRCKNGRVEYLIKWMNYP